MLSSPDPFVRASAAGVLASAGARAGPALAQLLGTLADRDVGVRKAAAQAVRAVGAGAPGVGARILERLGEETDAGVRVELLRGLATLNPKSPETVNVLVARLPGCDAAEARETLATLGSFGPFARDHLDGIVPLLEHSDWVVRHAAALAVGRIGSTGTRHLPTLVTGLSDANAQVRLEVGRVLRENVRAVEAAKDTSAIPILEEAGRAIGAQEDPDAETLSAVSVAVDRLRRDEQESRRWEILEGEYTTVAALAVVGAVAILLLAWSTLLIVRPRSLLTVDQWIRGAFHVELAPGPVGLPIGLSWFFLLHPFVAANRVLDSWVAEHLDTARATFSSLEAVNDRRVHVELPVRVDGDVQPEFRPSSVVAAFDRRAVVLIHGEGGVGKTSLACRVARAAMTPEPGHRAMIPVYIDHAFAGDLEEAVRRRLQEMIGSESTISRDLLVRLLRARRILVVLDGLSELPSEVRDRIRPQRPGFAIEALLVTSRQREELGGVPRLRIEPLALARHEVYRFMAAYLAGRSVRQRLTDDRFLEEGERLRVILGNGMLPVLFPRIFCDGLIVRLEHGSAGEAPDSLADLVLNYVSQLDASARWGVSAAAPFVPFALDLAWLCLEEDFRPRPAGLEHVLRLHPAEALATLARLEAMGLIQVELGLPERVRFRLDPVAEMLAAVCVVRRCQRDPGEAPAQWEAFLAHAERVTRASPERSQFLARLHLCAAQDRGVAASVTERIAQILGDSAQG